MANKRPNTKNLKPFPKGTSGNPSGKPKNLLTKDKVDSIIARFSFMNRQELQGVVQNEKTPMIEIMIASVMVKAAKDGDYSRLEAILNRSVGKVKETKELILPKPTVVERANGSQIVLGSEIAEEE